MRIISLAPATTEILYALGLEDQIVGITTTCNYPPEAAAKERVGTFSDPVIEKIIALRPDMLFATGLEQAMVVGRLRQVGLTVYVSDPASFEELWGSIDQIGTVTRRRQKAQELVAALKGRIERVRARTVFVPREKRPRVFIEIWHNPLLTAGRGSFVDELITIAGGRNIAYDTPRPYSYFSVEKVLERDPEYIFLGHEEARSADLPRRAGWQNVSAVKNKRVFVDVAADVLLRPGPRLVDAVEKIYQHLYPDENAAD